MEFYIAAFIKNKDDVRGVYEAVRNAGHTIAVDWTQDEPVPRSLVEEKQKRAIRDIEGVLSCDVFVILSEPVDGRAKYSEFGAALASLIQTGKPIVYVIGKERDRTLFYFHPSIKHKESIEDVLAEI